MTAPHDPPNPATPVKLPVDLRDWLKHQAIDNRRTLGNEIIYRLAQSRAQQQTMGGAQ
jgi:hypothetical protein